LVCFVVSLLRKEGGDSKMSQVYEGAEGTSFDAFLSLRSALLEKKVRGHFS
jgi:hypothetical protein